MKGQMAPSSTWTEINCCKTTDYTMSELVVHVDSTTKQILDEVHGDQRYTVDSGGTWPSSWSPGHQVLSALGVYNLEAGGKLVRTAPQKVEVHLRLDGPDVRKTVTEHDLQVFTSLKTQSPERSSE